MAAVAEYGGAASEEYSVVYVVADYGGDSGTGGLDAS